jgi:plastocyanin
MEVSDVTRFNVGDVLRMGEERLRVMVIPTLPKNEKGELPKDKSGAIEVDRGVLGSFPTDHETSEIIYHFPEAPDPSINQASCGQTAKAPAPSGTPGLIEPFSGQTVDVVAKNIAFDLAKITIKSNGQVRVRLDNQDEAVPHNIAFYKSSTDLTPVSEGSIGLIITGPEKDDTVFNIPAKGSYFFRCDVHPTIMIGTFVVE